jgi:purine-binding chemotaxis protein CheW
MDFLKIRKKAKERAASHAVEGADPPSPPPVPPDSPPASVVIVQDALPAPEPEPVADGDARFTCWRPGTGEAPIVPRDEEGDAPAPAAPPRRDELAPFAPPPRVVPAEASTQRAAAPDPAEEAEPLAAADDPLDEFFFRADEAAPFVPELGAAPAAADEASAPVAREEYLTFLLGAEEYAVAIDRVREVMKAPPITEVPRAPAHVLGVVTVRGEVVAVFDPRRRLGLPGEPPAEGAGRVVIVDAGEGPCGLLVDAVASVVRLAPGSIEPCPQGIAGTAGDTLAGIGRDGERLFTVLDLGALLRRSAPGARGSAQGRLHAG